MSGARSAGLACCLWVAGGLALAIAAGSSATLDGRWRLVEQTYGLGSAASASEAPRLRLELTHAAGRIAGQVWLAGHESRRTSGPAMFRDDEPLPVLVVANEVSAAADSVRVRYVTDDPDDDKNVLEIEEDYRLVEDGAALAGSVTVRVRHDGKDVGGYRLHRRFERER